MGQAAYLPHPVRRHGRALRPGLNRSRAATASEGGSIAPGMPRSVSNDLPQATPGNTPFDAEGAGRVERCPGSLHRQFLATVSSATDRVGRPWPAMKQRSPVRDNLMVR